MVCILFLSIKNLNTNIFELVQGNNLENTDPFSLTKI